MNRENGEPSRTPPSRPGVGVGGLLPRHVQELLQVQRLPAMLSAAATAALLDGSGEHIIPVLVREGLLRPLGDPPANAVKYFATVEVLKLSADVQWLGRARNALYRHWQQKNAAKTEPGEAV